MYSQLANKVQRFLPHCCVLCGQTSAQTYSLCRSCEALLPILSHNCRICAQFLSLSNLICGHCQQKRPSFERTYALFPYESPIVEMVIKLKFQHDLKIARLFGQLFIPFIQEKYQNTDLLPPSSSRGRAALGRGDLKISLSPQEIATPASQAPNDAVTQDLEWNNSMPDLIIPIPLHTSRLRQRGFNQALEIARPISKKLNIPIDTQGICRTKATVAQSSLPAKLRRQNIRQAFTSNRRFDGLKIALLDDVVTTGHTVEECSQLLKQQGAQEIDIWCVARRG